MSRIIDEDNPEWTEEDFKRAKPAAATMPFQVTKLAKDEGVALFEPEAEYPVWTPLNAFGAAETLQQLLVDHERQSSNL